ncbi:MAG: ParA family protein [Gammaproteobacteria bacterium]|nr:ParA family protein [Chromatiales bacterium]MYE49488.1 ParA family protein [Gammaproteobacteria bacterium]
MRTLAIISRKGGTGKTTLAVSLGAAAESHYKDPRGSVCIFDADPQESASVWFEARELGFPFVVRCGHRKALPPDPDRAKTSLLVIDTPPQKSGHAAAAVERADFVLIPARPGLLDLAAISASLTLARDKGRPAAVVLNAAPVRSPLIGLSNEALWEAGAVIAPTVHQRVAHTYAVAEGKVAAEREPGCKAAAEIERLWRWLDVQMDQHQALGAAG